MKQPMQQWVGATPALLLSSTSVALTVAIMQSVAKSVFPPARSLAIPRQP